MRHLTAMRGTRVQNSPLVTNWLTGLSYCWLAVFQFNSIQAFIDAAYMHGQRRLTISSKSKSALILVSVRTINLVEKKSFKFFPETRRVSGCMQL